MNACTLGCKQRRLGYEEPGRQQQWRARLRLFGKRGRLHWRLVEMRSAGICSVGVAGVGGASHASLVGPRAAGGRVAPRSCALLGASQKAVEPGLLLGTAAAQALEL